MNAKQPLKKILIINIFGIGDVLFTTPMIRNIKAELPESFIGYVCNKRTVPVLENNPGVNKLHIYEKDDYRALAKQSRRAALREFLRLLQEIKNEKYDLVFDLSLNKQAGLLTWLLGIRQRVGFNYKNRSPFLTVKVPINGFEKKHVVEYYLDLLKIVGIQARHKKPEVYIKEDDRQWGERVLRENNIRPDELLVGLVPGGGASWGKDARYRRWPPERHAQLADKIVEKFAVKVILLGDNEERDIGQRLISAGRHKPLNLIGATTLGQYLAFLSRCQLVVLNDGGPLHMAVAAGVRTVSLVATVDENVYGPYPPEGHAVVTKDIACRPCYRQFRRADCEHISCLNSIQVDEVFAKVEQALANLICSSPSPSKKGME